MEVQSNVNIAALIQQRQTKFIETRTIIESEVNKFLTSLESQDDDIKINLQVQSGTTARDWLPSLWAEDFNMTQYQAELARLQAYIAKAKAYADNLAQEAIKCLQS